MPWGERRIWRCRESRVDGLTLQPATIASTLRIVEGADLEFQCFGALPPGPDLRVVLDVECPADDDDPEIVLGLMPRK